MSKEKAKIDEWLKDLGPSKELLDDYKKKRIDWPEYEKRYLKEMETQARLIKILADRAEKETITLLCAEPTDEQCHRRLLKELIEKVD